MSGEPYEAGGMTRGMSELFYGAKEFAMEGVRSAIQFGRAVERRGSTLPLLRRFSVPSRTLEYEAIPLDRPGSVTPSPI